MATVQQTSRIITVKIARQNADGTGKKFMTYKVPVEKWTTVLDAVLDVKKYMDHSIGIRYSCRQATCGSCGMVINDKRCLRARRVAQTALYAARKDG